MHPIPAPSKELTGIEVTEEPTKTTYVEGETFDTSGMVVKAIYDDGSKETVTNYTFSPNRALTTSDTVITIAYNGFTEDLSIEVTPAGFATLKVGKTYKIKMKNVLPDEYYVDYDNEEHEEEGNALVEKMMKLPMINVFAMDEPPEEKLVVIASTDGSSYGPMVMSIEQPTDPDTNVITDAFNILVHKRFVRESTTAGWYTREGENDYTPLDTAKEYTVKIYDLEKIEGDDVVPCEELDVSELDWFIESVVEIG